MAKTAQEWLNTTYPDKTVSEIKLYSKESSVEELTGELSIKDYTKVERIDFERWDKKVKDKITKVIIDNCPQVKKIKFNNSEITEIIFQGTFINLDWLDLPDNKLVKIDVSKLPNLTRLDVARNPKFAEIEGWENLTKLLIVNLLDTPGLNGKKIKEWKDAINSAVGATSQDGSLPKDWKNILDEIKNRPTKNDLNNAVKDAVDKYKDYIDPKDKDKLEKAAKDAGLELERHKPEELKPTDYDATKGKLDALEKIFGKDKSPEDIKKEWESKSSTGGSGTGAALTLLQQEELKYFYIMAAYTKKNSGANWKEWKEFMDKWKEKNKSDVEIVANEYNKAQIEQVLIKK